jgi:hypothetical protein
MYRRVPRNPYQAPAPRAGLRRRALVAAVVAMTTSLLVVGGAQATPTGGQPSISGNPVEGATLTLTPGTWTDTQPVTGQSEQWYDCSSNATASCTTAITPTGTTYSPTATDAGKYIAVIETATDATPSSVTATSNFIGPIVPPAPTLASAPTVTGAVAPSAVLNATTGSWNNSPTSYSYQWYACSGSPLSCAIATGTGATTAAYTVGATEGGDAFEVQVTATNAGGPSAAAASTADSPAAPANTAGPTVTGTVALGQTLTASTGTWNNSPYAYAYVWDRCNPTCSAISGATTSTYTLGAADAGTTIEVQVTATNAGGSAAATSAGSALPAPPGLIGSPGISGQPEVGHTLTEAPAQWSNSPTSTTIQWWLCNSSYASCQAIAGATKTTYTPVMTDAGGQLQTRETATNAGGSTPSVSAFAGPVTIGTSVPQPGNAAPPTISGTAQQGAVMTATNGSWTDNPGAFGYQWVRCEPSCTPIPGATASSYALTATTPTSTSLLENSVALVTDQGVTLTATVTSGTSIVPPRGSVSFTNNGTGIKGCTSLSVQPGGQTGTISCQTAFVASTAQVVATYAPVNGSLATGSSSPVTSFIVGRAKARLSVIGPSQPAVRTKTTYTVKLGPSAASTGGVSPTGFVRFVDGTRTIRGCSRLRVRRLTASCTVRYDVLATHRIVAAYGGDANFQATNSAIKTVTVAPLRPTGFVTSFMGWTFRWTPGYTKFTQLDITNLTPATTISLTCQGGGCPFHNHRVRIAAQKPCGSSAAGCSSTTSLDLLPLLHGAHLRPGAKLIILITHSMWIGKYYQFVIVAGQRPQVYQACLAANSDRPGVGCTGG